MFVVNAHQYTHLLLPPPTNLFTFVNILELANAIHNYTTLDNICFTKGLTLIQKYLNLTESEAEGYLNIVFGDTKQDNIDTLKLLMLIFNQFEYICSYKDELTCNKHEIPDVFTGFKRISLFFKTQLKEAYSVIAVLRHGEESVSKIMNVNTEILVGILDVVFVSMIPSIDAIESFNLWKIDKTQNRPIFSDNVQSETITVGELFMKIIKNDLKNNEVISWELVDEFIEWGLYLGPFIKTSFELTPSDFGLVAGVQCKNKNIPIFVSGKKKMVIVADDEFIRDRSLILDGLMGCHVHLLGALEYLTIIGSFNCEIFVGAVAKQVKVIHSQNIKITGASSQLVVDSCVNVELNIFCAFPTIVYNSQSVIMGPCNLRYDGQKNDVENAKINLDCNSWDRVIEWGGKASCVKILGSNGFKVYESPFSVGAELQETWNLPLPDEFKKQNDSRDSKMFHKPEDSKELLEKMQSFVNSKDNYDIIKGYVDLEAHVNTF